MTALLYAVRAIGWACHSCGAKGELRTDRDRPIVAAEAATHVCVPAEVTC